MRVSVEISAEMHEYLKLRAVQMKSTMRDFILQALKEKIELEKLIDKTATPKEVIFVENMFVMDIVTKYGVSEKRVRELIEEMKEELSYEKKVL